MSRDHEALTEILSGTSKYSFFYGLILDENSTPMMGSFYLQPSRVLRASSINLPEFLIPAFRTTKKARLFSTSQPCAFRVGGAPIILPPGVTLRLNEPPVRRKNIPTRIEPLRLIEVEGPLGFQADIPNKGKYPLIDILHQENSLSNFPPT